MSRNERLERMLEKLLSAERLRGTPPRLAEALRYAVFPGGARVRPRLCLAVAIACGDDRPVVADSAAAAIELLHCASLVHDDLPCFDDALTRRGKPSVHHAYGEPLAVLVGDALIVRAFEALAGGAAGAPERMVELIRIVGASVGAPDGIIAGQAWECEAKVPLDRYQQAKTGALFAAATMAGAVAAGSDASPWRRLGASIGAAYQVADDLLDANGDAAAIGKPVGRDEALGRPSSVRARGRNGSASRLRKLVQRALDSIPPCPGEAGLRETIAAESEQFVRMALGCRAAA